MNKKPEARSRKEIDSKPRRVDANDHMAISIGARSAASQPREDSVDAMLLARLTIIEGHTIIAGFAPNYS